MHGSEQRCGIFQIRFAFHTALAALRQSGAGVHSAAQFDKNSAGGGFEDPVRIRKPIFIQMRMYGVREKFPICRF